MPKQLESILLLDDNYSTNFIHKKFIAYANCAKNVVDFQSGIDALEYLKIPENPIPELIFIDINMPIMSAWEFLENYSELEREDKDNAVIILLTTSLSPKDEEKAANIGQINGIWLKPLSEEKINAIIQKYFEIND
ncbi:response regulator [Aurantibacter crassamenti]|uniref:response regulator n=1 Tax=Aurantibacter crassamenti TaxID=1837375 RepID=UPI00193A3E33|nr:response regulator [Aurantibacter crassamenti]MBM1105587.1 response regulator [Aurantibacter crassamenti]